MKSIIFVGRWFALAGLWCGLSACSFGGLHGKRGCGSSLRPTRAATRTMSSPWFRFLLYVNEWTSRDHCNRQLTRRGENKNPEPNGLGVVQRLVRAYGECYANLCRHDRRYQTPEALLALTVAGYDDEDDAVKLIITAVDRDDPRPIWYADWGTDKGGAVNNLKRALDRVLKERGQSDMESSRANCESSATGTFSANTPLGSNRPSPAA